MLDDLSRDYRAMSGMIFGEAPAFEEIIDNIIELEMALNVHTEGSEECDGQAHGESPGTIPSCEVTALSHSTPATVHPAG